MVGTTIPTVKAIPHKTDAVVAVHITIIARIPSATTVLATTEMIVIAETQTLEVSIDHRLMATVLVQRVLLMHKRDATSADSVSRIGAIRLTVPTAVVLMTVSSNLKTEATHGAISDVTTVPRVILMKDIAKHRIHVGKVAPTNNATMQEVQSVNSIVVPMVENASRAITSILKSAIHVPLAQQKDNLRHAHHVLLPDLKDVGHIHHVQMISPLKDVIHAHQDRKVDRLRTALHTMPVHHVLLADLLVAVEVHRVVQKDALMSKKAKCNQNDM